MEPILRRVASALPFVIAAATLALPFGVGSAISAEAYDGLGWHPLTGQVFSVDPDGPSAGVLRPGERILAIEGTPAAMGPSLYSGFQVGQRIHLEVEGPFGSEVLSITLEEQPLVLILQRMVPLFVALSFWITGVGVLAFGTSTLQARLFFGFCLLVCATLSSGTLSASGPAWLSALFNIGLWFAGPAAVHLHVHFPEGRSRRSWPPPIVGLLALAGAGSLPYLIFGVDGVRASSWNLILYVSARFFLISNLLIAVALLLSAYRKATSVQARQRIRVLVLGGSTGLLLLATLSVLPAALIQRPLVPLEIGFLALMAIPLSYGYAIARHRLVHLEPVLSRGAAYTLVVAVLTLIYLLISTLIDRLLPADILGQPLMNLALVLLLASTVVPLHRRIQAFVDWAYYGGWYDYRSAVERITEGFGNLKDAQTLADVLRQRLQSILRLESASVFMLIRQRGLSLLSGDGNPNSVRVELSFPEKGGLFAYFAQYPDPIQAEDLAHRQPPIPWTSDEEAALGAMRGRLLVPIPGIEGPLGLLALGRQHGGEGLTAEDLGILALVARHVAAAMENLQLLGEVRRHAAEVERLHKQLLLAREDERKLLARELHDQVIQSLVALNYRLAQMADRQASELQQEVRQIIAELRDLIHSLRPPGLDQLGLVSAMRSHLRELAARTSGSPRFDLQIEGDPEEWIPEEVGLCLYRVLQEALMNVERHAGASRVVVRLVIQPEELVLTVEDDGSGFEVPPHLGQLVDLDHFGLVGLREQLDLVNGTLDIRSSPGEGTQLVARAPIGGKSDEVPRQA